MKKSSGKEKIKEPDEDYIEMFREMQDKQFVPGYYTGGRVSPALTHTGKPIILGVLLIALFVLYMIIFIVIMVVSNSFSYIIAALPSLLMLFSGIGLIRRGLRQKKAYASSRQRIHRKN